MTDTANKTKTVFAAFCVAGLFAVPALADTPVGVWLTPPDKKGVVAHIEARRCGDATCGVIARTFDKSGRPIKTPNLGTTVFWDMKPTGPGRYEGRAFVPAHKRTYAGVMQVSGNRMKVSGCLGAICQSQIWQRVD